MTPILANDPNGSLQKYVTSMLHIADINVSGYTVQASDFTSEDLKKIPIIGELNLMQQITDGKPER